MPKRKPQHSGAYQRMADKVRAWGYANPDYTCPKCGLPLLPGVPGMDTWDAGHVRDGEVGGALRPEHAKCNRSAGATAGNLARKTPPPSRHW